MFNIPIAIVLGAVVVFAVGISSGWYLGNSSITYTQRKARITIAVIVTITWLIAVIAEILIVSYTVHLLIHGVMGMVVGYLFSEDGLEINIGGIN